MNKIVKIRKILVKKKCNIKIKIYIGEVSVRMDDIVYYCHKEKHL